MMALLAKRKVSGVTATAHRRDGGETESALFKKFGFNVYDLFPGVMNPEAVEFEGDYMALRT